MLCVVTTRNGSQCVLLIHPGHCAGTEMLESQGLNQSWKPQLGFLGGILAITLGDSDRHDAWSSALSGCNEGTDEQQHTRARTTFLAYN